MALVTPFNKIGNAKYNFLSNGVNYAKRKVKQIKSYFWSLVLF